MYAVDLAKLTDSYKPHKDGYLCNCTGHEDKTPSLYINDADDKVLIHCFAGCDTETVISGMGIQMKDLFHYSNLSQTEKKKYAKTKNKMQLFHALEHELHVLYLIVSRRTCDDTLSRDSSYRSDHPEFKPMPIEPWEREIEAVITIRKLLGNLYE